jgi:DNA modification methylase
VTKPYYDDGQTAIYHADCRQLLDALGGDVLLTDPPYGIGYESGQMGTLPRSIEGDKDTSLRDEVLEWWGDRPALVFGTWRAPRPSRTRARLIWDSKGALGMGALDIPWKPADQEIYVLGKGFVGHRGNNVLSVAPVQGLARNGRTHPHEKPVTLLELLLRKCPPGIVVDPFMGTGSTLIAAKNLGRRAVGVEINEEYCRVAVNRLSQTVLSVAG